MLRILTAFLALALCACSNPDEQAKRLQSEGFREMDAQNFRSSVEKFTAALALNPSEGLQQELLYFRGEAHNRIGDYELALKDLELLRGKDVFPNEKDGKLDVFLELARAHNRLGRYPEAMKDLEEALAVNPESARVLNDFAWLLCTAPDESIIDAPRALQLATKAVERLNYERVPPTMVIGTKDTLAAAYAATGDFKKAAEIQASLVGEVDNKNKREVQARLELYLAGKAYRTEPPGN